MTKENGDQGSHPNEFIVKYHEPATLYDFTFTFKEYVLEQTEGVKTEGAIFDWPEKISRTLLDGKLLEMEETCIVVDEDPLNNSLRIESTITTAFEESTYDYYAIKGISNLIPLIEEFDYEVERVGSNALYIREGNVQMEVIFGEEDTSDKGEQEDKLRLLFPETVKYTPTKAGMSISRASVHTSQDIEIRLLSRKGSFLEPKDYEEFEEALSTYADMYHALILNLYAERNTDAHAARIVFQCPND